MNTTMTMSRPAIVDGDDASSVDSLTAAVTPIPDVWHDRLVKPLAMRIDKWINSFEGKRGRRHASLPYITQLGSIASAEIALEVLLSSRMFGGVSHTAVRIGFNVLNELSGTWEEQKDRRLASLIGMKIIDFVLTGPEWYELRYSKPFWNRNYVNLFPTPALVSIVRALSATAVSERRWNWRLELSPPSEWTPETVPMRSSASRPLSPEQRAAVRAAVMPDVYAGGNSLQQVAWRVSPDVLPLVERVVRSGFLLGFQRPADDETDEQDVQGMAERMTTWVTIHIAKQFATEPRFYFSRRLDFRGRIYSSASLLSPQGSDLAKALLRFSDTTPLGSDGEKWLAIHTANMFGIGSLPFADREQWVRERRSRCIACAADPLTHRWWLEANKPFRFLAACVEWKRLNEWTEAGNAAEEFPSGLPVEVDGTANGLQILAALARDERSGRLVNILPSDTPNDVYTTASETFVEMMTATADGHGVVKIPQHIRDPQSRAKEWTAWSIRREVVKTSIIAATFGGTKRTIRRTLAEKVAEIVGRSGDRPFGDDDSAAMSLGAAVLSALLARIVPGPMSVMQWLQDAVRIAATAGKFPFTLQFTSPSGLPVLQQYRKFGEYKVKSQLRGANFQSWVFKELDEDDPKKHARSIAANFTQAVDAAIATTTAARLYRAGVRQIGTNHDSFATVPGHMTQMVETLRRVFAEIVVERGLLEEFRQELQSRFDVSIPPPPSFGRLNAEDVARASYLYS